METNTINTEKLTDKRSQDIELLEFCIGESSYGVDIAKVRELLQYGTVQSMPHAKQWIEGVICPRDELLTVIDLGTYLSKPVSEDQRQHMFIVSKFNGTYAAFHVHRVVGIHRISEASIEKPDPKIFRSKEEIVTGVAKLNGNLISILDFEKIIEDVDPDLHDGIDASSVMST